MQRIDTSVRRHIGEESPIAYIDPANRQTIQSFDREEQQVYTALLDFKPVGQFKLRDRVVVPFLPWVSHFRWTVSALMCSSLERRPLPSIERGPS